MIRRDILKDEIDRFGKALAEIVADFLGLKSQGKTHEGIVIANEAFMSQLDIDMEHLLTLDANGTIEYLKSKNLTTDHIAGMADYIAEVGEDKILQDRELARNIFLTVLKIYDYVNANSAVYSFDRIHREEQINKYLKDFQSDHD